MTVQPSARGSNSLRRQQSQAPTPKQTKRELNDANKDILIEMLKRNIKTLHEQHKANTNPQQRGFSQAASFAFNPSITNDKIYFTRVILIF